MRTCIGAIAVACALMSARAVAAAPIAISDAWSRPAIETGVVYVRIANAGARPDRLIGARSPIAHAVELHRSMDTNDMSTMEPVSAFPVAAHGRLALAPGGGHIMLIGLRHDLHATQSFPLQLHFARAGWVAVTVHVRPL